MTRLAPTLQAFFTERLMAQRNASPRTLTAYRDSFRLLLRFAQQQTRKQPSELDFTDLDAPLVGAFLDHLEHERGNGPRTRNARLAAIHSMFRYAALRHPEHAQTIARVLDIPPKRHQRALVPHLDRKEIQALLRAPDRTSWLGRRDHTLLLVAIQTGLRVSELVGLHINEVSLESGAHVHVIGKRRKERCTPLTAEIVAVLQQWLRERRGDPDDPLFPTRQGTPLTPAAVSCLVAKHAARAGRDCPSLAALHITPHVLRHTNAMLLRAAHTDIYTIALWLGHESVKSTQIYLHADNKIKEEAIARTAPIGTPPGKYKPPDALLAFLDQL